MEFVRRNYHSSRPSILGGGYLPAPASNRTARAPSVSRFNSNELDSDSSIPPPYRSRESSVARRTSRDFSADRWSTRRDSSTANSYLENDSRSSNRLRSDRWSTSISPSLNLSSLPGRQFTCIWWICMKISPENERTFPWNFFWLTVWFFVLQCAWGFVWRVESGQILIWPFFF